MAEKTASQLTLGGGSIPVQVKTEPIGFVVVLEDRELCFWPRGFVLERNVTNWLIKAGVHEVLDLNDTSHHGEKIKVIRVVEPKRSTHPCATVIGPKVKGFWGTGARERAERFWSEHQTKRDSTL